jgi:CRISPR-associated protein Cmr2
MSYLMVIGIGPVQEFIASARRSRDLWFGSWLLSELSKAAAHTLATLPVQDLSRLIFPAVEKLEELQAGSEFNVVNKIVALVDDSELTGEAIRLALQRRLDDIRKDAYQNVKGSFSEELRDEAEAQVKDLVDFFWTAVKFENHEDANEYQKARQKVEYMFAARKATRNFISTKAWSDSVPKSSLDGQRESVIHEDVYDAVRNGKMTKEQLRLQFGVREGERLCGVGLLKRLGNARDKSGNKIDSFSSTSHVASLPLIEFLEDNAVKNKPAFNNYVTELSRLLKQTIEEKELYKFLGKTAKAHPVFRNYDGHILFEERLGEFFTDKEDLKDARQALKKFFGDIEVKQSTLLPYYALLLADGDAMGKAIDARTTRKEHQELSAELSQFAKAVMKIVELQHKGSLIYSGGDDVLAFVPLHTVLACAKELADLFAEKLDRFKISEKGKTYSPTLSVGIAVAHHLEPLEDALDLARKAEKAAKAVDGKNALAVIVDKRSGISRTLKGTWGTIDTRLNQFVEWHRREEIPDGAAYQLRDLANRLEVSDKVADEDREILQRAKIAEAKRILKRKEISAEALYKLENFLNGIRDVLKKEHLAKGNAEKDFVDQSVEVLADELIIAKIFAEARQLSQPRQEKKDE